MSIKSEIKTRIEEVTRGGSNLFLDKEISEIRNLQRLLVDKLTQLDKFKYPINKKEELKQRREVFKRERERNQVPVTLLDSDIKIMVYIPPVKLKIKRGKR